MSGENPQPGLRSGSNPAHTSVHHAGGGYSLATSREAVFFTVALLALLAYYIGWALYFTRHQNLVLIVVLPCAVVPVFYGFIGLWRENYVLVVLAAAFLIVHPLHVWLNLRG